MRGHIYQFLGALFFGMTLVAQPMTIYTEIFPPDQFLGPDGQLTGFSIELVKEIQKRTNNKDPIQVVTWARGYGEARTKPNVVLLSMARTVERDALFGWIGPIKESLSYLYTKSDSKVALVKLEQAKSLKLIGVYKEDVRDQFLVKAGFINLDRSVDQGIILKKLIAGRIDAMAGAPDSICDLLRAEGLKPDYLRPTCAFLNTQIYIAISKKTSPAAIRSWNKAFQAMKKDGTFSHIFRKYYPRSPLPGPAATPS
jgi:polar amino acid transport system substrate-binding protein